MPAEAAAIALGALPSPTQGNRWGGLGLLALVVFCGLAMQNSVSPVQEAVKLELGLSDFQSSLMQGLAVSIPVALLAIPLGRLTDRSNRVRLLLAMAVVWTAGTALTAFAGSFATLFAARMLANIGAILAIPIAISVASDLSAPERRGRALLPLSLGKIAGQAAAFGFGGWMFSLFAAGSAPFGELSPWRGVQLCFAIASGILIVPLLFLREPERHERSVAAAASFGFAMRAIWERRALLIPLFIGQVTVVMADVAAVIWAPTVLIRSYGQDPGDFAGWLGLVLLLSGIAGSVIGGFAADAGHKSRIRNGILIGAVAAAGLSIPGAFFPVMPGVTGFALLLALLMLCGAVTGLVTATTIAVLVPNELRGVCLGAFMVVGAVIGYGVAPTLVTLISELLGGEGQLRYALAWTTALTSLIAAAGFALAMHRSRPEAPPPSS